MVGQSVFYPHPNLTYCHLLLDLQIIYLLRSLLLDQLEHVLDEPLHLLLSDLPVPIDVEDAENPSQSLFCSAVRHDVEDQLKKIGFFLVFSLYIIVVSP